MKLWLFAVCGILLCACASPESGLTRTAEFEGGTLFTTSGSGGSGKFFVASLSGSWKEMGRQYGGLLGAQMGKFYNAAVDGYLIPKQHATYDEIRVAAEASWGLYSDDVKALVTGMSETSGLGLEKQKIVSTLMGMIFGCSSMDAWGAYTTDGNTVTGRNWDTAGGKFDGFGGYMTATIFRPDTAGAIPFVDVNYVGSMGMQNGMNAKGVFLDLQNGEMSDPGIFQNRTPGAFHLFDFLQKYDTLAQMDEPFKTTRPNLALLINGSDPHTAAVYEWSASFDTKIRRGDGLLASSNHYVDPSWTGLPAIGEGVNYAYTKERLANLLAQGEKYKGGINAAVMMQILDTPLTAGGPSFIGDKDVKTYYQLVVMPAHRTIWLKAADWSGWEKMDLRMLLR